MRSLLKRSRKALGKKDLQALPAPMLAKLIHHVGLEDAGEIVEQATTSQIERVFDEDLWKCRGPGEDETFDEGRFIVWLEVLLEGGDLRAGRRLAELSEDVLTLAFHRLILVMDTDSLAAHLSTPSYGDDDEDDVLEKTIECALSHEIGPYLVFARKHDGWDAILNALLAFDEVDHHGCACLLERCAALTENDIESADGGLQEVLSAEETLEADVAGERADRRAREGFVAPSDARSFLALAKKESIEATLQTRSRRDPVTRAYFRELDRSRPLARSDPGLAPQPKRPGRMHLLEGDPRSPTPWRPSALQRALEALAVDPELYGERMEELAFLVNVLVSGAVHAEKRAYRPGEAASAVLFVVNAGLEHLRELTGESPNEVVAKSGVVTPFRVGVRLGLLDSFRPD